MNLCRQAIGWFGKPKDVRGVKFDFTSAGLQLSVKIEHEDKGHPYNMYKPKYYYEEHLTEFIFVSRSLENAEIYLNPAYLLKYLQQMKGEFINIEVPVNEKFPVKFKSWNSDTRWYLMSCRPPKS
jgi:hypothetical protein